MATSIANMSPLTAMLKCPYYEKGNIRHESQGEAKASCIENGNGWPDDAQGGGVSEANH